MSSTTNHKKAEQAKALAFDEVIDLSAETLSAGVRRITGGYGADIVIDAIGGEILSEALSVLAPGGTLTTLCYSAGRKAVIDVTDLIWKLAMMKSFALMAQPPAAWEDAWCTIVPFLQSGAVKPIVAKTFPLAEAADSLRYLNRGSSIRQGRPEHGTDKLKPSASAQFWRQPEQARPTQNRPNDG